jgi:hypothetical protein
VSSESQCLDRQLVEIPDGIDRIYEEKTSGKIYDRQTRTECNAFQHSPK